MKIALLTLFVSASVAFAATYPVSISTTNGRAFGTTDISSLVGKIITGNVTNAAGTRVAYLDDVVAGSATNAVASIYTNGVALITGGVTNIDFVSGANTTVTGGIAGATAIIGISSSGGGAIGDIYVTNGYVTNIYNNTFNGRTIITSNLYATNIITTNLFAGDTYISNAFVTNLFAGDTYISNAFITNLFAGDTYTTNLYVTNLFAGDTYISNAFITNLFAGNTYTTNLITTNLFASNAFFTNIFATNAYITNIASTINVASNVYATNIITTNLFAGDTYISNAYITNLYVTNLIGGNLNGDGSGISNAAVLIPGSNVSIVTNTAGRVWTISSSASGGSGITNEIFSYNLASAAAVGATSVTLDRNVAFPAGGAGHLLIEWGTTNVEIRAVNTIVSDAVSFSVPLRNPHPNGARVLWMDSSDAFSAAARIVPASGTDAGWGLLQFLEESGNLGLWADGANQSPYTQLPLVAPNSTRVKNVVLNARAGYPLGNTNVYFYMGNQGERYAFTASAATDVITVPGGWSPPAGGTNGMVIFYAMGTNVLPQPLSNGIPYFFMTNSSTDLTIKHNWNDTSAIDLTTDGTGIMYSEPGSLVKSYMQNVYLDGQAQPGINGMWAKVQQQSIFDTVRIDNFKGIGLRLTGQQAIWNNLEIIRAGIGIDMRKDHLDSVGAQFMYFDGLNIEQPTNAIILGGGNNLMRGVHIETSLSTSEPLIDGSQETTGIVIDGLVYGGSPVLPNTNTLFLMGSAVNDINTVYELRNIYMSSAAFNSVQLMLHDQYRGQRIFAYNETNGGNRFFMRIAAPFEPTSTSYSSMFGGDTMLGNAGRFSTLGQQHQHETFHIYKAGTNDTGHLVAYWRSDGTTNSGFNAKGDFFTTTNAGTGRVLHSDANGNAKWDLVNQTLTNSNPVVPDFSLPVNYWQTNAAFLFLAPAGVDATKTRIQVTDVIVTNSTAAAILATFPASVHVTGTPYTTNVTVFHWRQYGQLWTNCACEPVW